MEIAFHVEFSIDGGAEAGLTAIRGVKSSRACGLSIPTCFVRSNVGSSTSTCLLRRDEKPMAHGASIPHSHLLCKSSISTSASHFASRRTSNLMQK